ncbi:MAG: hypothetical protein E7369_02545 [Clostridiales bacterium]|nr:hypothetical protein [Clostridiales bacterium]
MVNEEYAIDYCSYDVYDKFINLEFNVKDSNGDSVTVVDGKFTPTLAGEYTIELIATDRTGNSTTVTKTITIAEAPNPPAPPTPPQDDNQGGNSQPSQTSGCGCAGTFNVSSFILTLSAAVVIYIICKKIGKTKI